MKINSVSNVNFTSVIPLQIYYNENNVSTNKPYNQAVAREIVKEMAGKRNQKILSDELYDKFVTELEQYDPRGFEAKRSRIGYCKIDPRKKPSDLFKVIFDKYNNTYIVTGNESAAISRYGEQIGIELRNNKQMHRIDSKELQYAKAQYYSYIDEIVKRPFQNGKIQLEVFADAILKDVKDSTKFEVRKINELNFVTNDAESF